jgi:hypothetical protein
MILDSGSQACRKDDETLIRINKRIDMKTQEQGMLSRNSQTSWFMMGVAMGKHIVLCLSESEVCTHDTGFRVIGLQKR